MAVVTPTYASGYGGAFTVDATALPVKNWKADHTVGTFDATNTTTSGHEWPERTTESLKGTAEVMWKKTSGAPGFTLGGVYPMILLAVTGDDYTFNGLITGISPSVDVKGGVTYSLKFESQGAITPP